MLKYAGLTCFLITVLILFSAQVEDVKAQKSSVLGLKNNSTKSDKSDKESDKSAKVDNIIDVNGSKDIAPVEDTISPGDTISVVVEGYEDYSDVLIVSRNGTIKYKSMGEMQASGLTYDQLSEKIKDKLLPYISEPKVKISLLRKGELAREADDFDKDEKGGLDETPADEDIIEDDLDEEPTEKEVDEEEEKVAEKDSIDLDLPERFGYDIFAGARRRIIRLEQKMMEIDEPVLSDVTRDAVSGFVGPVDMMGANVSATVPSNYVLGPGDELTIHFWSDLVEFQTEYVVVDDKGEVVIPRAGKLVVRGMTLSQFQEAVKEMLERVAYKNLTLIATLEPLRSVQIFITGEAFRPGSYFTSAVTTLFNALYLCGGPNNNGSLRNIKLKRNNETKSLDFYKFLMEGDSSQDVDLYAGDTILISPLGKLVNINGEVKRPNQYELKQEENLQQLISMAGGIKPSGYLQRVQIDSVIPGRERIVRDVDVAQELDIPIFDGDIVTVFSIPSERMNTVTIEGKVRMPGIYQLKEGMKVSDLIRAAQGLLGEAYTERADLLRLNTDEKTTTVIPINLLNALAGDAHENILLRQWDKLVVYSKWDVKWHAERIVTVQGAVVNPGSYERHDGMTVSGLLMQAGGLLPEAYTDRALLMRMDNYGELNESIIINLTNDNLTELRDGDTLIVYTYHEAIWHPEREVTIEGAVQNPDSYSRTDGMKVYDLIHRAGGLLPQAYPDRALLLRHDERQRVTKGFFISPKLALQDDPKNNLELKDGDRFIIYTYEEARWEPVREVSVTGAVQNPAVYQRTDGMRVSDLILRAGGLLPNAHMDRADIKRMLHNQQTHVTIKVDLTKALSGDRGADTMLEDEDTLVVYTIGEVQYRPENMVTIYGAVQRPDIYTRTEGMKLSDLIFVAGGTLPGAHEVVEINRIGEEGSAVIITSNINKLQAGDSTQDITLEDEDVVSIRKRKDYLDSLRTVVITGEVKYPGSYVLKHNERLSDIIGRAGGITDRAYPEASVVTRSIDYLILNEQRNSTRQVKKLLDDLNEMEYQREVARVLLMERRDRGTVDVDRLSEQSATPFPGAELPGQEAVTDIMEVGAMSGIPDQAETALSGFEGVEQSRYQYTLVTPARNINSYLPPGRVIVNLQNAMDKPGTKEDILLEDGDRITIPAMPATISVTGAVIQPLSLVYIKGKGIKDYIQMVGGYSRDADQEAVYIIKANGMVEKSKEANLSPGDIIVVPTKVMVQKVTDRWGQIIGGLKFAVTTLAMVITIKLILDRV
jgi:protein involved in polysaccharide export with SLBB domain